MEGISHMSLSENHETVTHDPKFETLGFMLEHTTSPVSAMKSSFLLNFETISKWNKPAVLEQKN